MNTKKNNWIISKGTDLLFLFTPVWILWIVFLSNPSYFEGSNLSLLGWVIFILGIDVSHVWSSLFRTYLNKEEFLAHKQVLIIAPIIAFVLSLTLLFLSVEWFWRAMAYLAVFHFIKQQYGFLALYKGRAGDRFQSFLSDKFMIYFVTIYPVLFWHFNADSSFNWFVQNDFFQMYQWLPKSAIGLFFTVGNYVYWAIVGFWLFKQWQAAQKGETISTGKVLWLATTALNWWLGIVYFNSDLVFSVSNVVAHGVPYIALIYYYGKRKTELKTGQPMVISKRLKWILALVATVLIIAFIEEYFWDMLIYREHDVFFESIYPYRISQLIESPAALIALAILALPQQVHYIIDGFIWRMNARNKYLKSIFSSNHGS